MQAQQPAMLLRRGAGPEDQEASCPFKGRLAWATPGGGGARGSESGVRPAASMWPAPSAEVGASLGAAWPLQPFSLDCPSPAACAVAAKVIRVKAGPGPAHRTPPAPVGRRKASRSERALRVAPRKPAPRAAPHGVCALRSARPTRLRFPAFLPREAPVRTQPRACVITDRWRRPSRPPSPVSLSPHRRGRRGCAGRWQPARRPRALADAEGPQEQMPRPGAPTAGLCRHGSSVQQDSPHPRVSARSPGAQSQTRDGTSRGTPGGTSETICVSSDI